MSKELTDKQIGSIIETNQLSNQNSINLSDGTYLVEKINNNARLLFRTKKGEKCTPVLTEDQVVPKGAQSFTFATCRLFTADYESTTEIMVPDLYLNAPNKTVFIITVNKGYSSFEDRPASEDKVSSFLATEIEA